MKTKNYVSLATSLFVCLLTVGLWNNARRASVHQKARNIDLFNAPRELEERHVWITEHATGAGRYGDIPVHILFRPKGTWTWELCGTGTILGRYPDSLLTAYHVFEGRPGQYGYRKIGPDEITGAADMLPIISCDYTAQADDAITCKIGPKGSVFPIIDAPVSMNMMHEWIGDKDYRAKTWPVHIHLTTYPEKRIQGVMQIEVRPGTFHILFDWAVMPGESGTTAIVEEEKPNAYLVIIRGQKIPKIVIDQLTPENKKLLNWSEDKLYGVGNLIGVNPPTPK